MNSGLNGVLDSAINIMTIKANNFELKSLLLFNHKDGGKVILIKVARLEFFWGDISQVWALTNE